MIHMLTSQGTKKSGQTQFEGLLIEYSSGIGYRLSRYFYENGKYQNETLIDEIITGEVTKEKILEELEEIVRKRFPTEKIFVDDYIFEGF